VELDIHDVTEPTTSIDASKINQARRRAKFFFSGADDRGAITFVCRLDHASFTACTSPAVVKRLKPGKHSFDVKAVDAAGNRDSSAASKSFRIRA
jgi:hypothetical protein